MAFGWIKDVLPKTYQSWIEGLSLLSHFESFAKGVLTGVDLIYFFSFIVAFLGLTFLSIENQRWRA